MEGTPTTLDRGEASHYRHLARAVILQAVKDRASRGVGADRGYRDRGRRTQDAHSAREFLSTESTMLTFWCLWLNVHPETILEGSVRLTAASDTHP
jgi:hypothetical protein